MPSVVLYGLELSAPCRAVLLTAKAIGVDVQFKTVNLMENEHMLEAFTKINPAHCVPALDDNGFHIWESRAIMGYLVQQYGKDDHLYPKEPKQRALVDNILQFDLGALYASFATYFYPKLFYGKELDPDQEAKVKDRLQILDTVLSRNVYVAGSKLTIADFSVLCSLSLLSTVNYSLDPYPNIRKWQAKAKSEIPFYEEVVKNGEEQLAAAIAGKLG